MSHLILLGFALTKFPIILHYPLMRWFGSYSQNADNFYQQDSHYPFEIVVNFALLANVPLDLKTPSAKKAAAYNQKVYKEPKGRF